MAVITYEGTVEGGQIRLDAAIRLPEHAKVYVVVPENGVTRIPRIASPRLAHPEQIAEFELAVSEVDEDAGV